MCPPFSKNQAINTTSKKDDGYAAPRKVKEDVAGYQWGLFWPLHPMVLIAILPLLPTWMYLNRGYTVWFHLTSISYLITQSDFLRRFLVVQGTSITLGWYAAICNDLYLHNRFFHILYMNMPSFMKAVMLDSNGGLTYSSASTATKIVSNVLDTAFHPGLTFIFWTIHCRRGGTFRSLLTWPVIVSAYLVSRIWSMIHTYHNFGKVDFFYFGYDVYKLNDLDSWLPAYVAEGAFFALVVAWKVCKPCINRKKF